MPLASPRVRRTSGVTRTVSFGTSLRAQHRVRHRHDERDCGNTNRGVRCHTHLLPPLTERQSMDHIRSGATRTISPRTYRGGECAGSIGAFPCTRSCVSSSARMLGGGMPLDVDTSVAQKVRQRGGCCADHRCASTRAAENANAMSLVPGHPCWLVRNPAGVPVVPACVPLARRRERVIGPLSRVLVRPLRVSHQIAHAKAGTRG